jgi:predicted MFS family arabinose efflux permease
VVATLLAGYALVAAVTTVPLVRLTAHWPRRRTLLVTLISLTVSQGVSALAPSFAVLAGGRVLCALTHGLMWSVVAPIGVRLVPPSHAGRATTAVYVGTGLALVVGSPFTAALSQLSGWRAAIAAVALAAAVVTVAARLALPPLALTAAQRGRVGGEQRHTRNKSLVTLCVLTLFGVTGHFISYTFIVVIIRDVVGLHGPRLGWVLAAYGIAGLTAMALMAHPLDRRPKATVIVGLGGMASAFVILLSLACRDRHTAMTMGLGIGAIVLWGAMATALPPMLQSAAMQTSPEDPDGASGLYVAAFQVGIMAGSLAGGILFDNAGIGLMIAGSALLMLISLAGVAASRGLFGGSQTTLTR